MTWRPPLSARTITECRLQLCQHLDAAHQPFSQAKPDKARAKAQHSCWKELGHTFQPVLVHTCWHCCIRSLCRTLADDAVHIHPLLITAAAGAGWFW